MGWHLTEKDMSQALSKPAHFHQRVKAWRQFHPGYWRKKKSAPHEPLQPQFWTKRRRAWFPAGQEGSPTGDPPALSGGAIPLY